LSFLIQKSFFFDNKKLFLTKKIMKEILVKTIGIVKNQYKAHKDHRALKVEISTITIFDEYIDALVGIDSLCYIDVLFYFHESESRLQTTTFNNRTVERGVFSSRSPRRPNLIGVTGVKLINREGNTLWVEGLDAINGTPVIDIKSADTSLFAYEIDNNPIHLDKLRQSPRIEIRNDIYANRTDSLMNKAAALHGHYCPGLAMGIMASVRAMNMLEAESDGMEDLLAITEINSCFSDGVQFVTGCTFGNNALIYKDIGKTAFTLTKRDGKGIRIATKASGRDVIKQAFPDFQNLYQKVVAEQNHSPELMALYKKTSLERAFGTLSLNFDDLFTVKYVNVEIPIYAKIQDSTICSCCGESVMATRIEVINLKKLCYTCAKTPFNFLDGNGIHCK